MVFCEKEIYDSKDNFHYFNDYVYHFCKIFFYWIATGKDINLESLNIL